MSHIKKNKKMAYVNNGWTRKKKLTLTKGTYTRTYVFTNKFVHAGKTYQQISDTVFQQMPEADYEIRRAAFIAYVYSLEAGLESDCPDMTIGSTESNPFMCPIK